MITGQSPSLGRFPDTQASFQILIHATLVLLLSILLSGWVIKWKVNGVILPGTNKRQKKRLALLLLKTFLPKLYVL